MAILVSRSRDIARAEDALGGALVAAIQSWPQDGVPANPEAWLLTTARNLIRNAHRHEEVRQAAEPHLARLALAEAGEESPYPDERLKLLFVCAHPAIDPAIRAPLMLQVILGLDAVRIAGAFLTAPAAMGQRLVRAKAKIKEAGLRFEQPEREEMPARLADVLDAIYAAYGVGWDSLHDVQSEARGLTDEAIFLCRLLVSQLPNEPEPKGLLALMLYCEARSGARFAEDGSFIPLDRQDHRLWSRDMIIEAENLLMAAATARSFGRFQCEAALQSVHIQKPITGKPNHEALLALYGMLLSAYPSVGAHIGRAAVLTEAGQADHALQALEALPPAAVKSHQPFWVTLARVQQALGLHEQARHSRTIAIGLTENEPVRRFLLGLNAPGRGEANS